MPTIYQIVLVALLVTFAILVLTKTGVRNFLRDKASYYDADLIADMLECDLCLSFWISAIISVLMAVISKDLSSLLIPVFSTPISRFLI